MTLDELKAEFPLGSRWRIAQFPNGTVFEVAAVHPNAGVVLWDERGCVMQRQAHILRTQYERIPDPVPCPITEPVTLSGYRSTSDGAVYAGGLVATVMKTFPDPLPPITLLPGGKYTWEGQA